MASVSSSFFSLNQQTCLSLGQLRLPVVAVPPLPTVNLGAVDNVPRTVSLLECNGRRYVRTGWSALDAQKQLESEFALLGAIPPMYHLAVCRGRVTAVNQLRLLSESSVDQGEYVVLAFVRRCSCPVQVTIEANIPSAKEGQESA